MKLEDYAIAKEVTPTRQEPRLSKLGLMMPEFPGQTHVAMWRVGQALREAGVTVQWLSTRHNATETQCHDFLVEEASRAHYVYPPNLLDVLSTLFLSPGGVLAALRYIAGLNESSGLEKLRCLVMLASAADLKAYCHRHQIDHIFLHSCANGAHVVAMCYALGGPTYSLRLGGDLEVYGHDHASKMRHASFIAAAAKPTRQQVIDRVGVDGDRVYSIWLGVDTQRFVPPANRHRQVGQLRTITVARLNPAKGHHYVLQAIKMLLAQGIDIHHTMIGSGPDEQLIQQQIEELDLTHHVTLTGSLGESQVIHHLQTSDAFILASVGLGEASPVAVLEGMSCGLPAVCSIIGGTPDIVTDGADGFLVPQGDAEAIADQLTQLANNIELRETLGQAARRRAVEAFDCRISAQRLLKAIETHAMKAGNSGS